MTKTAFIGLGVMGGPMAGHLAKAGHQVTVYNRTAGKAENWVKEHGGESARPRPRPPAAPKSSAPVSATTTTSGASFTATTASSPG